MASSGGGKKKTKWKAVDPGIITNTQTRKTASWADESENDFDSHDFGGRPRADLAKVVLPTAPRAARGPEMEASIPKEPPYQAYLSNLSYEVTEDDLADFFADMKVKSVRLPKDDRGVTIRAKGFGYVEFDDRNSLIEALSMPDTTCKGRRMRIEVAEADGGRGGRGGMRDRGYGDPDRTTGDWRSGPRSEAADAPSDRDGYRSGGMRRDYGSDRDRRGGGSSYRDDDRGGFRRDGGGGFRDDGFRDRGFRDDRRGFDDRDRDRGGGGGGTWRRDPEPRGDSGPSFDRGEERRGFDRGEERRGFDRGEERRGFDRGEERRGFDDRDRDRDRDRGGWRRDPEPRDSEPPPDRGEPKQRQRLNLQPRTKPVEAVKAAEEAPAGAAPAPNTAAIFGGARPVDTAAREREIEERLNKQRDSHPPPASSTSSSAAAAPTSQARSRPEGEAEGSDSSASAPVLEPAPPPRENVWARRSQQTNSAEVR